MFHLISLSKVVFGLHTHLHSLYWCSVIKEEEKSRDRTMCGGAIISDFIPTARRVTSDYLWPDLKKGPGGNGARKKKIGDRRAAAEIADDDFEADFQEFDGEAMEFGAGDKVQMVEAKPLAFTSKGIFLPSPSFLLRFYPILIKTKGFRLVEARCFSLCHSTYEFMWVVVRAWWIFNSPSRFFLAWYSQIRYWVLLFRKIFSFTWSIFLNLEKLFSQDSILHLLFVRSNIFKAILVLFATIVLPFFYFVLLRSSGNPQCTCSLLRLFCSIVANLSFCWIIHYIAVCMACLIFDLYDSHICSSSFSSDVHKFVLFSFWSSHSLSICSL